MNEALTVIQSLDATMTSQLVATLAGLSIAATSFLSSSSSNIERERQNMMPYRAKDQEHRAFYLHKKINYHFSR